MRCGTGMAWRDRPTIIEYGGDATVVAGLIRYVFEDHLDPDRPTSGRDTQAMPLSPRLMVQTPPVEDPVSTMLTELGVPREESHMGMLRIVNAAQLLAKVAPGIEVVAEREESLDLSDGQTRLTIGRGRIGEADLWPGTRDEFWRRPAARPVLRRAARSGLV